jgi:hypothetical protein
MPSAPTSRTEAASPFGTPFEPGRGPTSAAWREEAITRANEFESLAKWIAETAAYPHPPDRELLVYVHEHLKAVRCTAAREDGRHGFWLFRWWTDLVTAWRGANHQRTLGNLDAVEATLLRIAPDPFVIGELPSLQAHVNRFLETADPRLVRVSDIATKVGAGPLSDGDRGVLVAALHAANTQRRRDLLRVRSFRNVMFVAAGMLVPLVAALAIFGFARPTAIPLCFNPVEKNKVVCPTAEVPFVSPTPSPAPTPTPTSTSTSTPAPTARRAAAAARW